MPDALNPYFESEQKKTFIYHIPRIGTHQLVGELKTFFQQVINRINQKICA